jgi:GAF domain-containing protein
MLLADATTSPAPAAAPIVADIHVLAFVTAAVVVVSLICAFWRPKAKSDDPLTDVRALFFGSAAWRFLQSLLIGMLLIASAWEAYTKNGPDATTAIFLAFIIIVALIPIVQKFAFPLNAGSVDLLTSVGGDTRGLKQDANIAQTYMANAAWTIAEAQSELALRLASGSLADPAARKAAIMRTLIGTTQTVSVLLRPPAPASTDVMFAVGVGSPSPDVAPPAEPAPNVVPQAGQAPDVAAPAMPPVVADPSLEELRITAWQVTTDPNVLRYVAGWPLATTQALEGSGIDLRTPAPFMVALRNTLILSYANLSGSQRPATDPKLEITYGGIAFLPMKGDGKPVGVLCIERHNLQQFGAAQIALGRALAALYGLALSG